MAINYPGNLDTTASLPDVANGQKGEPEQINDVKSAVIALQNKVGSDNL